MGRVFVKKFPCLKALGLLLICLSAAACATDRPPTGGAADTTPLAVVASDPASGSVNQKPKTIRLTFNHHVTSGSLAQSIFFSPAITGYSVAVHDKEAEIRLHDTLRTERTYTLILKKSLKSIRGNELERSWALAFSTGAAIDTASLRGKAWSSLLTPAANTTVLAYPSPSTGTQQPNPATDAPEYIAQTDAAGTFEFDHLAKGSYRLFAVTDTNFDQRFNPEKEEFGVTTTPSVATGGPVITFRLSPLDSAATTIVSLTTHNCREIDILFNRPVALQGFDLSAIAIQELTTGTPLPVMAWYSPGRMATDRLVRIVTGQMKPASSYRLSFTPQDKTKPPVELVFQGSGHALKHYPLSLSIIPADKSTNTMFEPVHPQGRQCINLNFSHPVVESTVAPAVSLVSVKGEVETAVPLTITKTDSRTFSVKAVPGFEPGRTYRITLRQGIVSDIMNIRGKDSLVVSRFTTAEREEYGEISGAGRAAPGTTVIIEARRTGTEHAYRKLANVRSNGTFSYAFHNIPPGDYTLSAFLPLNRTVTDPWTGWQHGRPWPFAPCEPFAVSEKPLNVRPGWITENTGLDIPSPQKQTAPAAKPAARTKKRRKS